MELEKKVQKKLVTVKCPQPFSYNNIPFVGVCNKVTLTVDAIKNALSHKAFVVEHLKNGKTIPLGFDNFDTWNGPTEVDDHSEVLSYVPQEIEMIDGFGNRKIINKKPSPLKEQATVLIDLEAEKLKEALLEQKKQQELQAQKEKEQAALQAKIKEEQKERDRIAREKAAAEILAKAKADLEEKKTQKIGIKPKSFSIELDATAMLVPEESTVSSNEVVEEKTFNNDRDNNFYGKKNKKNK